jgi:hypothetical protein
MRFIFSTVVVLLICCLAYVGNVEAFGLGVSGSYGSGTAKQTYESTSPFTPDPEYKYDDTDRKSIGLVLDTNLSKDKLFNYRLGLAYETVNFKRENQTVSYDPKGCSLENDFGFGIIRTDFLRLWLGPELRFAYLKKPWENRRTTHLVEAGIGPVVGLNFNIGSVVTLSVKGGYIFNKTYGSRTNPATATTTSSEDTLITGSGNYPIANLALIFRIGE